MKTFTEFVEVNEKIKSLEGLTDVEKVHLCSVMFDTFKEYLSLVNENIELKATLNKAHAEVWR